MPKVKSERWKPGLVKVDFEGEMLQVKALIYGKHLAVHGRIHATDKRPDAKRGWLVTHVPTGKKICWVAKREDAKRIAERFWAACSAEALADPSGRKTVEKTPREVVLWLKRCANEGRFVEEQPA